MLSEKQPRKKLHLGWKYPLFKLMYSGLDGRNASSTLQLAWLKCNIV